MKEKRWFPILYMFIITAVFSSALIGFSRFTAEKVTANKQFDFEKALIESLGLSKEKSVSEIHKMFTENIIAKDNYYILTENGKTQGYAVAFDGKGFWAPIKGILGIASDGQTITGIAFYEQNETPGLGGEIVKPKFRNQFIGKKLNTTLAAKTLPITIKPFGSKINNSEVHAITGATQTCTRLEKLINEDVTVFINAIKGAKK